MVDQIFCTNCLRLYPDSGAPYRCLSCGGFFDFVQFSINPKSIDYLKPGIWKYRHTFGLPEDAPQITLGEGNTPLIWSDVAGKNGCHTQVGFKCEYINPSGSFKDRGSALIISFLLSRGIEQALDDSSGNAGASLSAYAARAGVHAKIFAPDRTSGPKRKQIEAYGAELVRIQGSRSNSSLAAQETIEAQKSNPKLAYGSHAYLPMNLPGYATVAYELFDQINGKPGTVILPVGQGGLFLGIARGFQAMVDAGRIQELPFMVGVQAQACAPIWAIIQYGRSGQILTSEGDTVAEGIRVSNPIRGDAMIRIVEEKGWKLLAIEDKDILAGQKELAKRGFFVEPTSAVIWEAVTSVIGNVPEPIVVILTGSGLKSRD